MSWPDCCVVARISSRDADGLAALSTAMAPATCGAACEVPAYERFAAVINAPGARSVRKYALFEKQGTWSAVEVKLIQPPNGLAKWGGDQICVPRFAS